MAAPSATEGLAPQVRSGRSARRGWRLAEAVAVPALLKRRRTCAVAQADGPGTALSAKSEPGERRERDLFGPKNFTQEDPRIS